MLPNESYEHGKALMDAGNYSEALPYFQKAVLEAPSNVEYIIAKALAHDNLQQINEALVDYSLAIRLDSSNDFAYYLRGLLYAQEGDSEKALADFESAANLDPKDPDYQFLVGEIQYILGHNDECIAAINKAINLSKELPEWDDLHKAYQRRSTAYLDKGNTIQAIEDAKQANIIKPDDPIVLGTLGLAYSLSNQPQQALKYLDEAVTKDPEYVAGFHLRGLVYIDLNETQKARLDFERALQLDPTDEESRRTLQNLNQGLLTSAKKIPQPPQKSLDLLFKAGEYLDKENASPRDIAEAERLLRASINEAGGVFPHAQSVLAVVLVQQDKWKDAEKTADQALSYDPLSFRAQIAKTFCVLNTTQIMSFDARGLIPRGIGALYIFEVFWKIIKSLFVAGSTSASQMRFKKELERLLEIYNTLCHGSLIADEWLYISDRILVLADLMREGKIKLPGGTPNIYAAVARVNPENLVFDPESQAAQRNIMSEIMSIARAYQ